MRPGLRVRKSPAASWSGARLPGFSVPSSKRWTKSVHSTSAGADAQRWTTSCRYDGAHSSSSSRKASTSPMARSAPLLRAPLAPVRRWFGLTRSPTTPSARPVLSVQGEWPDSASLTTMTSAGGASCAATERSARSSSSGRSQVGMMTLTRSTTRPSSQRQRAASLSVGCAPRAGFRHRRVPPNQSFPAHLPDGG